MKIVSSAMPSSSSLSSTCPTCRSWSIIVSWYCDCHRPDWPTDSGLVWVRKCMWVVLTHRKNGTSSACLRSMKSMAPSMISSSIVSIRLRVSGPVSSMVWVPSALARQRSTPRGP